LSADLPLREVPVESLKDLDTEYWFDGSWEVPTVRNAVDHLRLIQEVDPSYHLRRIQEIDPSYPIILGADGRVMDGMYRVARALLEGHTSIRAVRFAVDPEPNYRNCRPEDLPYDNPGSD
jgi:hypothetical protein